MATYPAPSRFGTIFNITTYQNSDQSSLSISPGPLVVGGDILCTGGISGTITKASQPQITSLGTLTSLNVNGNISGTLSTTSQPQITSLGTLTSLDVTGNVNSTTGTYKIGGNSVFTNATTLAPTVIDSSLTSIGTQATGVNIASGQTYKIGGGAMLSSSVLGASIVTSSLTSVGTLSSLAVSGRTTRSFSAKYGSANQSITNGSTATVTLFNTDLGTQNGTLPLSYATGVWTATAAVTLTISYSLWWAGNANAGDRQAWISLNNVDTTKYAFSSLNPSTTGVSVLLTGSCSMHLANTETIRLKVLNGATASINLVSSTAGDKCTISIVS